MFKRFVHECKCCVLCTINIFVRHPLDLRSFKPIYRWVAEFSTYIKKENVIHLLVEELS